MLLADYERSVINPGLEMKERAESGGDPNTILPRQKAEQAGRGAHTRVPPEDGVTGRNRYILTLWTATNAAGCWLSTKGWKASTRQLSNPSIPTALSNTPNYASPPMKPDWMRSLPVCNWNNTSGCTGRRTDYFRARPGGFECRHLGMW
jgi:hypothetical protein